MRRLETTEHPFPDALKAADVTARAQSTSLKQVQQTVANLKANPTRETMKMVLDATALASSFFIPGGEAADAAEIGGESAIAEGAATDAADAVTDTSAAADTSAPTSASAETPAQRVATNVAAKASIPEGTAAQEEIPEVTNEDEAPTVESKQPEVHQNIRDAADAIAKREGFTPPPADTPLSEIMSKGIGDQFYARAKAGYAAIKDATGVDLETIDSRITDLQQGIKKAFGDTDKVAELKEDLAEAQKARNDATTKIEDAGLDPNQPSQDWKGYRSAYDVQNKAITPVVKGKAGVGAGEVVDPNALATRLKNMSVSKSATQPGRLQQFMGNDVTNTLRNNIEQYASDIKNLSQQLHRLNLLSATGQKALAELLERRTGTGIGQAIKQTVGNAPGVRALPQGVKNVMGIGEPQVGDIRALFDYEKMSNADKLARWTPEEQQTVAEFLQNRAAMSVGKLLVKGYTVHKILDGLGIHLPLSAGAGMAE